MYVSESPFFSDQCLMELVKKDTTVLYCYISNVVHHNIIKIISMFLYTVEALVKKSVVTRAGCLQEYYCSVPLVEIISSSLLKKSVALRDELNTSNFIRAPGYKSITINFAH